MYWCAEVCGGWERSPLLSQEPIQTSHSLPQGLEPSRRVRPALVCQRRGQNVMWGWGWGNKWAEICNRQTGSHTQHLAWAGKNRAASLMGSLLRQLDWKFSLFGPVSGCSAVLFSSCHVILPYVRHKCKIQNLKATWVFCCSAKTEWVKIKAKRCKNFNRGDQSDWAAVEAVRCMVYKQIHLKNGKKTTKWPLMHGRAHALTSWGGAC